MSHMWSNVFVDSRIEETWRLWSKFLDDYSRFEDWLQTAELTAAVPESSDVLYTSAKEELKKYEVRRRFSLVWCFCSRRVSGCCDPDAVISDVSAWIRKTD